jgi:hypothetical protein
MIEDSLSQRCFDVNIYQESYFECMKMAYDEETLYGLIAHTSLNKKELGASH